ncbi:MAG: methyltransferase domain-containing protein [Chloroflexi bacterium]|nr:methyltransferase domain-containing protein [Chloroflexota bacterium]
MEQNFTIPDQWMIPNNLGLYLCSKCGMAYLDADKASQDVYDDYYRSGQFNFVGQNDLESTLRLEALGLEIQSICESEYRILDVGGEDGHLLNILVAQGFTKIETCGPSMDVEGYFDLLVMSHLVEHIYDMDSFFARLRPHLKPYTRLMVEIPVWTEYPETEEGWQTYDFNLIHINKFRSIDLSRMFSRVNFKCDKTQNLPNVRRFKCLRYQGHYMGPSEYPVIVWGLSDDVLNLVGGWNVEQYVDRSPVYRGCTIKGVPILDHVESSAPIVIGAIHSKDAIREEIRAAGLLNELIYL